MLGRSLGENYRKEWVMGGGADDARGPALSPGSLNARNAFQWPGAPRRRTSRIDSHTVPGGTPCISTRRGAGSEGVDPRRVVPILSPDLGRSAYECTI